MSKTKALLAILLVGAAWASVATRAERPPGDRWEFKVCHRGKLLTIRNKHRLTAHFRHGDTLPKDDQYCPAIQPPH